MRIFFWITVVFTAAAYLIYDAVADSKANLVNDPSSMAWVGFLPFIAPMFLLQAMVYVVPVAVITKVVLWVRRRK